MISKRCIRDEFLRIRSGLIGSPPRRYGITFTSREYRTVLTDLTPWLLGRESLVNVWTRFPTAPQRRSRLRETSQLWTFRRGTKDLPKEFLFERISWLPGAECFANPPLCNPVPWINVNKREFSRKLSFKHFAGLSASILWRHFKFTKTLLKHLSLIYNDN